MYPDLQIAGKVALVTGASGGMGEQFARVLAAQGARVAIAARRVDKLAALAREIEVAGGTALPVELDVSSVASVRQAADTVEQKLGPIEILVNNAGVSRQVPAVEVEEDFFDWIVDTNVKGAFFMAQAAGRQMIKHGIAGRIVNISSVAALRAQARLAVYGLSKSAVAHMTKTLALEWAAHGINVNAICPGYVLTPMSANYSNSEAGKKMISTLPRGRAGQVQDLDSLLLFLVAGEASRFITGTVIPADDGHCAA